MNNSVWKSKKFQASCLAAISGILAFTVSEFGLELNVEKTMTLVSLVIAPFLIYIGAEGYSEQKAKAVIEEEKGRKDLNDQVLNTIEQSIKDKYNEGKE
jgi:high-affinity Fe2+/Pb2+ permease